MKHDARKRVGGDARPEPVFVYGAHVLMEALRHAPEVISCVHVEKSLADRELLLAIERAKVRVNIFSGRPPKGVDEKAVHQGAIAEIRIEKLMQPYTSFIEGLSVTPDTALLLLGEVQDPQNVGAVIRSAAAFGISGVLIPPHNQAQVTGAVIKVSAGMAFRVPLVAVTNMNTTVRDLKEHGFWIYGLDGGAPTDVSRERFTKPSAFILGNEADGLRLKTKEHCDILLRIATHPQCESLNAAAATAVVLHAWSVEHPSALTELR